MLRYTITFFSVLILVSCEDKKETTVNLFNYENLNNWYLDVPLMDSVPNAQKPFIIRNSNLVSLGEPRGHLVTKNSYKNYRLDIEYRFPGTPGNCGILVHASQSRALYKMFPKSIEVQMEHQNAGDFWVIVEDIVTDNMIERRGPKEEWGITEGKKRRIKNLTDNSEKPLGKWNSMVIECYENEIKVWVNGVLVNYGYDATINSGKIAVQAEGSEVEIRKLTLNSINKISTN